MNKEDIYKLLEEHNIPYTLIEHEPMDSMEEMYKLEFKDIDRVAKNLFLKDDKKNYYLVTILGHKKIDLKQFRSNNNLRSLSFVKESELEVILNLKPGSVTPFGLLNDINHLVTFYIDSNFYKDGGIIGIHPNDNIATILIKTEDLMKILNIYKINIKIIDI